MKCNIKKELYEELKQCLHQQLFSSIKFFVYHKGMDITFDEGIKDEEREEKLKSALADWWYSCDFETGGNMALELDEDDALFFSFEAEYDNYFYGDPFDDLEVHALYTENELRTHLQLNEEIELENVDLELNMSADSESDPEIIYYSLIYHSEEQGDISLTENEELKQIIIQRIINWYLNSGYAESEKDYSFSINIEYQDASGSTTNKESGPQEITLIPV